MDLITSEAPQLNAQESARLLSDPLMGNTEAKEYKQLMEKIFPVFRSSKPRVMQLGSEPEVNAETLNLDPKLSTLNPKP